jgi:4'-phosphopantetheinyl transferase EntD
MVTFLEHNAHLFGFSYGLEVTAEVAQRLTEEGPAWPANALTTTEAADFRRLSVEKRRVEWLSGRLAARSAYRRFSTREEPVGDGGEVSVLNDLNRAPFFTGRPDLRLSISHSHEYAVAVLAAYPIGVDIEKVESRPPALINYFFSDEERDLIRDKPLTRDERDTLITMLWSRKEAVSKVVQRGASLRFRSITAVSDAIVVEGCCPGGLRLLSERCGDYCIALAFEEPASPERGQRA